MNCRKERKAQRIALLIEIERLNKGRCTDCYQHAGDRDVSTCGCQSAVRIREIGKLLLQTTPRKEPELLEFNYTELNRESFADMKSAGLKDQLIADHFKMALYVVRDWKKRNGLSKRYAKKGESQCL